MLDPQTGRVSPQHHAQFDPSFQTMRAPFGGNSPQSLWQQACGFTKCRSKAIHETADFKSEEPLPEAASECGVRNPLSDVPPGVSEMSPHADDGHTDPGDDEESGANRQLHHLRDNERNQSTHLHGHDDDAVRRFNREPKPLAGERLIKVTSANLLEVTTNDDGTEGELPHEPAQGEVFCLQASFECSTTDDSDPLLAFAASVDLDNVLCCHKVMREPDFDKFKTAMTKEIMDQWDHGNFSLIKRKDAPDGALMLPGVWALKQKRSILTNEVKSHKGRWNLNGRCQQCGVPCTHTCSPMASWPCIHLLLGLALVHDWHTKQIDSLRHS